MKCSDLIHIKSLRACSELMQLIYFDLFAHDSVLAFE